MRAQIGRIHWIRPLLRSRWVGVEFGKGGYLIGSEFHNRFPSIGFGWRGDDRPRRALVKTDEEAPPIDRPWKYVSFSTHKPGNSIG